jgi:hypothetical protein
VTKCFPAFKAAESYAVTEKQVRQDIARRVQTTNTVEVAWQASNRRLHFACIWYDFAWLDHLPLAERRSHELALFFVQLQSTTADLSIVFRNAESS